MVVYTVKPLIKPQQMGCVQLSKVETYMSYWTYAVASLKQFFPPIDEIRKIKILFYII